MHIDMSLYHILILESCKDHGLKFQQIVHEERFFSSLCSFHKLLTSVAYSFSPGQFTDHEMIENDPIQSAKTVIGTSLSPRRSKAEGWKRLVRSNYSIVKVKIRRDGVSSLLRANYKLCL